MSKKNKPEISLLTMATGEDVPLSKEEINYVITQFDTKSTDEIRNQIIEEIGNRCPQFPQEVKENMAMMQMIANAMHCGSLMPRMIATLKRFILEKDTKSRVPFDPKTIDPETGEVLLVSEFYKRRKASREAKLDPCNSLSPEDYVGSVRMWNKGVDKKGFCFTVISFLNNTASKISEYQNFQILYVDNTEEIVNMHLLKNNSHLYSGKHWYRSTAEEDVPDGKAIEETFVKGSKSRSEKEVYTSMQNMMNSILSLTIQYPECEGEIRYTWNGMRWDQCERIRYENYVCMIHNMMIDALGDSPSLIDHPGIREIAVLHWGFLSSEEHKRYHTPALSALLGSVKEEYEQLKREQFFDQACDR